MSKKVTYIIIALAFGFFFSTNELYANSHSPAPKTIIKYSPVYNFGAPFNGYRASCPPSVSPCATGGCYGGCYGSMYNNSGWGMMGGGMMGGGMMGGGSACGMWGYNPYMWMPYYPYYPYRRAAGYKSSGGYVNVLGLVSVGWGSSQGGYIY